MGKFVDITGKKYSRLTVISRTENKVGGVAWLCKCECGKESVATTKNLNSGHTKSCGCYNNDVKLTNNGVTISHKSLYKVWFGVKQRCQNKNIKAYKNYGGRGISICEKWDNSFQSFLEDVGERPSLRHSLDRIDNNGNYEPSNIKWSTKEEQARNTRKNKWIEYNGERLIVAEWERRLGMRVGHLAMYLRRLTFEEIVTTKSQKQNV